jgi:signal transduction histidine kinase
MGLQTRPLLIGAMGGLLLLIAATGVTAVLVLDRIHRGDETLRARVAGRSGRLERIRRSIYLSSALARDYLVEPEGPAAETLRTRLAQSESAADREFAGYPEAAPLRGEVIAYWRLLDLMADMAGKPRRPGVDAYFRQQLGQRREAMLHLADDVNAALDREAQQGAADLAALFTRFRSILAVEIGLVCVLGLAVSTGAAERLLRLESETRALSAQLLRAQEDERRAIARELHDEVAQALSGLLLEVGSQAESAGLRTGLERTVDSVRRIALSLRPSMLDDLGLVAALEWQARETGNRTGLNVEVVAQESAGDLPEAHRTCIYRVAQEALQNCARHAGAGNVRIELARVASSVTLRVVDDGKGFAASRSRGLGLLGMAERVEQLGGRFRVHSEVGHGATLVAELPL